MNAVEIVTRSSPWRRGTGTGSNSPMSTKAASSQNVAEPKLPPSPSSEAKASNAAIPAATTLAA